MHVGEHVLRFKFSTTASNPKKDGCSPQVVQQSYATGIGVHTCCVSVGREGARISRSWGGSSRFQRSLAPCVGFGSCWAAIPRTASASGSQA